MHASSIAIIGYVANVPGAQNANALWHLTANNLSGLKHSSQQEQEAHLTPDVYQHEYFINVGGGPSDYKQFDADFFGISPKEACLLDPQIRKSLECAWLAIEHAGYNPLALQSSAVGVYLTSSLNSYFIENLSSTFKKASDSEKNHIHFLNEPDFLASRLAYHFNWRGPAFNIKCGCSSSLVAIHEACQALLTYDCDMALSGGVAIKSRYQYGYLYEQYGILAQDGRCCPFSEDASGTLFANGIGFVVLKRLEDAIQSNDTIHAVIRATAINNDGNDKAGYMAPSVSGQISVIQTAMGFAELSPEDITYIEAHGTGTAIGDPIEYQGLMTVFAQCPPSSIALRSVKANIGHLDAASGVVGLIKVLLDRQNQVISPNHNFTAPNKKIATSNSPFYFDTHCRPWHPGPKGRIAGVSSFGIGGTNAHLILQEYRQNKANLNCQDTAFFIPLSAKNKSTLMAIKASLVDYLKINPDLSLPSLSYTLLMGRAHFNHRIGIQGRSITDVINQLSHLEEDDIRVVQAGDEITIDKNLFLQAPQLAVHFLKGAKFTDTGTPWSGCYRLPLPGYQFVPQEHWIYPHDSSDYSKCPEVGQWFYMPYWKREEKPQPLACRKNQHILIFHDKRYQIGQVLEGKLVNEGSIITSIAYGEIYTQHTANSFEINPYKKSEYQQLFTALSEQDRLPSCVLHAWSLDAPSDDFDQAQYLGLYSLLFLIQTSIICTGDVGFKLAILTQHIANVSGNESINPNNATLLGITQVLPKEHEQAICHLMDIDVQTKTSGLVDAILNELSLPQSSDCALRGMRRFIKAYDKTILNKDSLRPFKIEKNKNYLVIGGLGNFGLELSQFIGAQHQGRVFLSTRMEFPDKREWNDWLRTKPHHTISEKIRTLQTIEAQGAHIEVVTIDVADKSSISTIKQDIEQQYGPLSGVVHAAGIVDSGMLQHKTIESLNEVFQAKVLGTRNVWRIFQPSQLDFLILCSSMNAIIGGLGQVDNTAANAYIDAYAEFCAHQGHAHVLAINWGAVNEARARSYSTLPQFAALSREHIKNKMTLQEVFEVYFRLFSTQLGPRVVISTIDFNQVIENWSRVGSLQSLLKQTDQSQKQRDTILQNAYQAPASEVEQVIAQIWQSLLGIDTVGKQDDFFALGGHSLVAIQFISQLTKHFPIKMHAMSIYEYPCLQDFAAYATKILSETQDKAALRA